MTAVIFANGELKDEEQARHIAAHAEVIIAADGGARHCLALDITPQVVIGDLDSLNEVELQQLSDLGAEIIKHDVRKDETDLELALLHARQLGMQAVTVLAGLGGRWDMSLANLLLPAYEKLHGLNIRYVQGATSISLVSDESHFEGQPGDTVSLIPVGGDASGIHTKGLEYPLDGEALYLGATRGISNQMTGQHASVMIETGMLLCVIDKQK